MAPVVIVAVPSATAAASARIFFRIEVSPFAALSGPCNPKARA
jgi:hypothetical protein